MTTSDTGFEMAFIYPHLLGHPVRGTRVLEAMCGSGQVTRQLLGRAPLSSGSTSRRRSSSFQAEIPHATGVRIVTDLGSTLRPSITSS